MTIVRGREAAMGARSRPAWGTPTSAAFFVAIIVLALVLARLLAPLIDLHPG